MKKIIISSVLLAFAATSFCQQTAPKQSLTKTDYLQKSKKQKKTGTILLAVGTGLVITAFVIPRGELIYDGICIGAYCTDKYKNDGIKTGFAVSGVAVMLGSIPFFIASGKNKKRANATSAFFRMEKIPVYQNTVFTNRSLPTVGFKISL